MRYALTAEMARAIEASMVASGTTMASLMERAGRELAAVAEREVPQGPVVVVCGPGNNGGDGWVAARALRDAGREVTVLAMRHPEALEGEARGAADAAVREGVRWTEDPGGVDLGGASLVIDALLGLGATGALRAPYVEVADAIEASDAFVVAADVPSGVDADTGAVPGSAVHADVTVTFIAPKAGLIVQPGAAYAGRVVVADLDVPPSLIANRASYELWDLEDYRATFPFPRPTDHKGSRARVGIVAGSLTYAGAALLAMDGALRMGAGFVYAAVPEPMADLARRTYPSALIRPIAADAAGSIASAAGILEGTANCDAVVVGPGLTITAGTTQAVRALVAGVEVPIVLDADGLNAYAGDLGALDERKAPIVITPNAAEAARLLDITPAAVAADPGAAAVRLASATRCCVMKGPQTVVAWGNRRALVTSGNPGLAKAGSGDVLAGMLGTLVAQQVPVYDAAVLAVHLHGRAATHGAATLTETSLIASDITAFLPDAVRELTGE